jgi:Leucine-rich repeat (LRR) protein
MKKDLSLALVAILLLFSVVAEAQNVSIPDVNFKAALVSSNCALLGTSTVYTDADTNNNGQISIAEAQAITALDVSNKNIQTLGDMYYFSNMTTLDASNNLIGVMYIPIYANHLYYADYSDNPIYGSVNIQNWTTLVDLKLQRCTQLQELTFGNNMPYIQTLDIRGCTTLTQFNINYCYALTTINMSDCTSLQSAYIITKPNLTSLNMQNCVSLQGLQCANSALIDLNITNCTALQSLYCTNNNLTNLDLSTCTALQNINCTSNQLNTIGLQSLTNLRTLDLSSNQITALNLQNLPDLQTLTCTDNPLTVLNIQGTPSLAEINCASTLLTTLNLQSCPNLTNLNCTNNNLLATLNLQGLTALQTLNCANNQLVSLNVQGMTALQSLNCANNQIPSLNLQGLTALQSLYCEHNQLTNLNIQGLTNFQNFKCSYNQITALNIANNPNLTILSCSYNQITTLNAANCTALTGIGYVGNPLLSVDLHNCPLIQWFGYTGGQMTYLNLEGCSALLNIFCNNNQLTYLNTQGCTALESISCQNNQLTILNVQGANFLRTVNCENNQITSINIQGCIFLNILVCHHNQLAALDVSANTYLNRLFCNNNQLTTLNVQGCQLQALSCYSNHLSTLNLSGNIYLTTVECQNNTLTNLNLQGCTGVASLTCHHNQLATLNLQNCASLLTLPCNDNQLVTLDIQGCIRLDTLICDNNPLSILDVQNCSVLRHISCKNNRIPALDVHNLTSLTTLDCRYNQMTTLNVSGCTYLQTLNCANNLLTTLNLQGLTSLYTFKGRYNQLSTLNLQGLTTFSTFDCSYNQFATLPIPPSMAFDTLRCDHNQLATISVPNARNVDCSNNQIRSIDISVSCNSLNCDYNQLDSLHLPSNGYGLKILHCGHNRLRKITATNLFLSLTELYCNDNQFNILPELPYSLQVLQCSNNPNLSCIGNIPDSLNLSSFNSSAYANTGITCIPNYNRYITAATSPLPLCAFNSDCNRARFIYIPDPAFKYALLNWSCVGTNTDADTNNDGGISQEEALAVTSMNIDGGNFSTSASRIGTINGIHEFKNLTNLTIIHNWLGRLDIRGLTNLTYLDCTYDMLSHIEAAGCTALQSVSCGWNSLRTFNFSGCPNLTYLGARNNNFESIDLQGLTNLQTLDLDRCATTNLDLRPCTNIRSVSCTYGAALQNVNAQNCINLQTLDVKDNRLRSVNVKGCAALTNLNLYNNRNNILEEIDVQDSPYLQGLDCGYTDLRYLYLKNGSIVPGVNLQYNPNLSHICTDANEVAGVQNAVTNLGYTQCTVDANCMPEDCFSHYDRIETYSNSTRAFQISITATPYNRLLWTFGDGAVDSTHTNMTHRYNSTGTYTVCLTLHNDALACSDVFCDTVNISILTDVCPQNSFCIFPGDTNNDGVCNNNDVLAIGLMNGSTEQAFSPSTLWLSQRRYVWNDSIPNTNLNTAYADCDGNGIVESLDIAAIYQNYKRTHNGTVPTNREFLTTNGVPIRLQFARDTFAVSGISDTIIADIFVGTSTLQATNFYGFATSIAYDPTVFRPVSMEYNAASFMGGTTEVMVFGINNVPDHTYDIAITRRAQTPVTGNGRVARIKGVIEENIAGKEFFSLTNRPLTLGVQNTTAIDGVNIIIPTQNIGDTCQIKTFVATENTTDLRNHIRVFPNPTPQNSLLNIETNGVTLKNIILTNILGQIIIHEKTFDTTKTQINTQNLSPAVYLLQITTDKGVLTQKIVVQ